MTVAPPAPPPLSEELDRLLRRLRLPYLRRAAPEVIATAASQRWEPSEVLRVLLAEEAAGRDRATVAIRRRSSGLPAGKTFDAWEPTKSAIPKATQHALRTLEWVDRAEVLVVCGPSGTGKSHFIEALGHLAIDTGKSVAWHTLDETGPARPAGRTAPRGRRTPAARDVSHKASKRDPRPVRRVTVHGGFLAAWNPTRGLLGPFHPSALTRRWWALTATVTIALTTLLTTLLTALLLGALALRARGRPAAGRHASWPQIGHSSRTWRPS